MKILIESPFGLNNDHKLNIENKISKLSAYNEKITQVNVFFKLGDGNIPNAVTAEVQVHVPGPVIFGSEVKEDYWDAFLCAFNKVKRQMKESKEIQIENLR